MFYRKNLYAWEQMLRVGVGLALFGYALLAIPGSLLGYGLAAVGAAFALTGVFGFSPMCAMAGRQLRALDANV